MRPTQSNPPELTGFRTMRTPLRPRHVTLLAVVAAATFSIATTIFFAWLEGGVVAADPASLWKFSLHSWSTRVDADGQTTKIIHEPLGLLRNLSLVSVLFVYCFAVLARYGADELQPSEVKSQLELSAKRLDSELTSISQLVGSYLEKSRRYSGRLAHGQSEISNSSDPEQVKAAIRALISENQRMLEETSNYQRDISASRSRIEKLEVALAESRQQTERDSLTFCYNRRYLDAELPRILDNAQKAAKPVCLVLADIDHFKSINDQYGHLVGDEVIKLFAETLTKIATDKDIVVRFGGEEFAIVMPDKNLAQAVRASNKMCETFGGQRWDVGGVRHIHTITASFGVSQWRAGEDSTELLRRADAYLYASKSKGRNCVVADTDLLDQTVRSQ